MKDKKKFEVVATRKVVLTQEDIDDIIVAALEGGITYWCCEAEVVEEKRCADWGHEQIARGGALILHDTESGDKWELNLEKFLNGIKLWLENGGDIYNALQKDGTLDTCEIDGEMADMIVQYAIFGQLIFG